MEKNTEKAIDGTRETNKTWEAFMRLKGCLAVNDSDLISVPSWIMDRVNAAWDGHPVKVEYPKKKVSKTLEAARRLKGSLMVNDPKYLL